MKKSIIYSLIIILAAFYACDPIEDRDEIGYPITADELDVTATPVVVDGVNSNKVILENHSPVNSEWNYGVGITRKSCDTVLMVVTGSSTITFTGLNPDGSYLTKEIAVTVDELSFDVPEEWGLLCGTGEKTWVWDDTQADNSNSGTPGPTVFGNGGYLGCSSPCWWNVSLADVDAQAPGEGDGAEMVFSVSGASLTKKFTDGSTEEGSFSFDMSKTTDDGNGGIWAKGKLNTKNTTVLAGIILNDNTDAYEYDILMLDEDYLSLSVPRAGVSSAWGEATFWMFKKK